MKITKQRLKQIIKEELETVLNEDEFANNPDYEQTGSRVTQGGREIKSYKRKDPNPNINKLPKIQDDSGRVIQILMQIKGMDRDRANKIVNDIGDRPMKQLGSWLRFYLNHNEIAQISSYLYQDQ